MKNLVIVESPAKVKTIEKYLGKDYIVTSSKGHIRDLATKGKYGLGVDLEDNFKPTYTIIKGKKKIVDDLKKEVKNVDFVYLATDPDREGEAISYHLFEELGIEEDKYNRIIFNEITSTAVLESLNHPKKIDRNIVNSQETRRILDRIIGFRLSKLMQSKTGGKSAGRVQSVALKLIVDKEREIEKFVKEEYWTITSEFKSFTSELVKYKTKKLVIKTDEEATDILDKLSSSFKIEEVLKKEKKKASPRPFITSTLQQVASSKLNINSRKTMSLAQKLYEGIDISSETVGLITYMRTDSIRLSNEFVSSTNKYITTNYGKEYVGAVKKSKKTENVQDAHEAIRPTDITRDPLSLKAYLTPDEYKLYRLIYFRTLASLMSAAVTDNTSVTLDNNDYKFKTTGQVIKFDGYLKVYSDYEDTKQDVLPPFDTYKSNIVVANEILKEQHFTQPPARFSEGKLIKALEELGIGRPSTYSAIIFNIKDRGYVIFEEKRFKPTEVGIEVTDKLQLFFKDIINVKYTANMEKDLDEISLGKLVWSDILKDFYDKFVPMLDEAFDKMEKKPLVLTGEKCPECGSDLVIRNGKYGEFTACSNFPKCKYIKQDKLQFKEICDCPNCDGKIVERKSRRGKVFYGCNNYPKCKTAYWDLPTGEKCPKCGEMLVEKNGTTKCSSKECDFVK